LDFRTGIETIRQRLGGDTTEERIATRIDGQDLTRYLRRVFSPQGYEISTLSEPNAEVPSELQASKIGWAEQGITVIQIRRAREHTPGSGPEEAIALRIHARQDSTAISLGRGSTYAKPAEETGKLRAPFERRLFRPAYGYFGHRSLVSKVWGAVEEYVRNLDRIQDPSRQVRRVRALDDTEAFIDRTEEIDQFKRLLNNTLDGYPEHLAIMGEPGIGKTVLLRRFEEIASQRGCLVVRRELDFSFSSTSDLGSFLVDAFQGESVSKLPRGSRMANDVMRFFDSHGLSISAFGTGVGIFAPGQRSTEAMQERLARLLQGVARKLHAQGVPGVVFLLDDADRLDRVDGAWEFLRKTFVRANESPGSCFMLVLAGSRLFSRHGADFPSTRRFFRTLELGPFDPATSVSLLRNLTSASGVRAHVLQAASRLSGGHPLILYTFASEILSHASSPDCPSEVRLSDVLPDVTERLSEGFFWDRLQETDAQEKIVLRAMSDMKGPVAADTIRSRIRNRQFDARPALNTLRQKGSVRMTADGRFILFSPMFGDYVKDAIDSLGGIPMD
jgi:hypothetical protein